MESTSLMTFGELLRQYRTAAGLTQEHLAERAKLSARAIVYLEQGARAPYADTISRLVSALNLAPSHQAVFQAAARTLAPRSSSSFLAAGAESLPVPATDLIGRAMEVASVTALLQRPGKRLLTLTGPGGVGKTRVALQVAWKLRDRFPDGAVFVSLGTLRDAALVIPTIAQALAQREVGVRDVQQSLQEALYEKELLLVLDNFEQVGAAAADVSALLAACPRLAVLVTSRVPLHVRAEQEFPVLPLALPMGGDAATPEALAFVPSVALFVQRAQAVEPAFTLTRSNATMIAAICTRLDGLPLAIELAAAQIKAFSPAGLLNRLARQLQVLTGGALDLPERQKTMRDTVAWSYELLRRAEQVLFRRLAVFHGGCTLESIEAVCPASGEVLGDLGDLVALLVDKSLCQRRGLLDDVVRYDMLETVREYGLELLESTGEIATVQRQHAAYYLHLSAQAEPELTGPRQALWLARVEAEVANLRAALQWARQEGEFAIGLRLITNLDEFWWVRGNASEVLGWLDGFLDRVAAVGGETTLPVAVQARTRLLAGGIANRLGDCGRALREASAALELYRRSDDAWGMARSFNCLAEAERGSGKGTMQPAITYYEHAVAHLESIHTLNPKPRYLLAIARALAEMSNALACEQGSRDTTLLARIRTLIDEVGRIYTDAETLLYRGHVRYYMGDNLRACELYERCRLMALAAGDTLRLGIAYNMLGEAAFRLGDLQAAEAHFRESEPLRRALEDRPGLMFTLRNTAAVACGLRDYPYATLLYQESLDLVRTMGDARGVADVLRRLGDTLRAQGGLDQAGACYAEGLLQARRLGDVGRMVLVVERVAGVAGALGRHEQAARLFAAASALCESLGARPFDAELIDYLPSSSRPVDHERDMAAVRTGMGADAFAAAWTAGQLLPLEQALAEALAVVE